MAASCQKEDFAVAEGDYAEVSFTADIPGIASKAIADGNTVNKLYYEVYAASDADGTVDANAEAVAEGTADVAAGDATVNVRLVKNKKYTIFFWAQYEGQGYTSPYTVTDLRNIGVSYTGALANDEKRDAFYAVEKAVSFSSAATEKVTLTRPFAQVNVATSDLTKLTAQGITLGNTSISVSDVATSFAPFTGVASGSADAEFATAAMANEDLTTNSKTYDYLAMAYVLVPGSADDTSVSTISSTVSFTGLDPITVSYEGATLKQNHRTNIVGNLLTSSVDFEVTVDSDFDGADSNLPMDPNDLAAKLNAYTSTTAVVYNIVSPSTVSGIDIEIPGTFVAETVTFNFIEVKTGATLTIKDATDAAFDGEVVINLPENVSMSNLTVNLPNAHVTLNQGNVTTVISSTSSTTFVVADGVKVERITVNAGNVKIEKGAEVESIAVDTDNTAPVTVITLEEGAEMPIVTGTSGSITVKEETAEGTVDKAQVKVGKITYINNSDEWAETDNLATAILGAAAGSTVTMGVDVKASEIIVIDKNLTLNGNGYTLKSTADRAINVSGANSVTIQNLTIMATGERGINIIQNSKNVTIENVTATARNYTVAVPTSAPEATVTINNSDLTGLNTINIAAKNTTVNITDTKITCNDQASFESYGAISINKDGSGSKVSVTGGEVVVKDDSIAGKIGAEEASITFSSETSGNPCILVEEVNCYIPHGPLYYYAYASLEKALEKAEDGETIYLSQDVTLTETVEINKNVTINLNGQTLTANVNKARAFKLTDGVEFTLDAKDSNVEFGNGTYGIVEIAAGVEEATVTINDGTFEGTTDNGGFVRFRNGSNNEVNLNNVTYTDNCGLTDGNTNAWVINAGDCEGENNKLNVTGGTYTSAAGFAFQWKTVFSGVVINSTSVCFELMEAEHFIDECTINADPANTISTAPGTGIAASNNGKVVVQNSTVNSKATGLFIYSSGGEITATDCTINAVNDYKIVKDTTNYPNATYTVTIGDTVYTE